MSRRRAMMVAPTSPGGEVFLDTFTSADGIFDETRLPDSGAYIAPTSGEIISNTCQTDVLSKTLTLSVARGGTVTMGLDGIVGAAVNITSRLRAFPRWVSATEGLGCRLQSDYRSYAEIYRLSDGVIVASGDIPGTTNINAGESFRYEIADDGTTVTFRLIHVGFGEVTISTTDPEGAAATTCQVTNQQGNVDTRKIILDNLSVSA